MRSLNLEEHPNLIALERLIAWHPERLSYNLVFSPSEYKYESIEYLRNKYPDFAIFEGCTKDAWDEFLRSKTQESEPFPGIICSNIDSAEEELLGYFNWISDDFRRISKGPYIFLVTEIGHLKIMSGSLCRDFRTRIGQFTI